MNVKWEQRKLGDVAKVTMGQSPSSKNYTDNPNDYVLVQGNADLKSNEISPRVWTKEVTKQVHKGEFIMTVRAPVGYLAMANMDAVIGRGVAAIDGNKYLYYLLQTKLLDRTWEKLSSGSTFESISSNDIKNLEIKVTETEEEKLIAKLMDTVTYFVTLQQRKLEQLKQLKKAMLQQLFVDKNNKQPNLRFKNFNGDWEQRKLGEVIELEDNKRKPVKASKRIPGNIPYYGANGVQDYVKGYTHTGEHVLVAEDGANSIFNYPVYFICSPSWINNHSHVLTGKRSIISNKFLTYDLKTVPYAKYLVGSGRYKLNAETLKIIPIKLPLLTEQNYIGSTLSKIDTLITLQQNKLTQLTTLKKYLLQKMFI
ncbi:restriction endonuclease subunit S [Limosilactobacillus agrestis]|uniref:restriction endonuclease subunit S n=1 Tax=Limosilactobacillus agrestis TaxID=2759748 RepID=UPI0027E164BF|nr:restriction endonuclease subunit S [Limosilactobacillus agrestis]